jgi:3-dehydroquinate synthase
MLKERNIFLCKNAGEELAALLKQITYSKVCVIVDENTREHCLPRVISHLSSPLIIEVKSGEENKTLITCEHIWSAMTEASFDRHSLVINLGGGVIGDMGGFCASTYKRGIRFIQVPTTLLSQVDASVGGKLGVDFNGFKNHIGVFAEPTAVIVDNHFFATLPQREIRSGYAEVLKHCLIADKSRWDSLKGRAIDKVDLLEIAGHSIEVKAKVTAEDPKETGLRKILNFGHTIGHAIESHYLETSDKLLHGEAIAIGMIAEAKVAQNKGFISDEECNDIKMSIIAVFGQPKIPKTAYEEIIPLTLQDKKNNNGTVLAALLQAVGTANYDIELSKEDIKLSLDYYNV